jgi:NDP-4-keto-2,6-dideoxyhexose 3-C-methyltransferase
MAKCRICKSENLIEILNLGEQYLSEFRGDDKKPPKFPLVLTICNECKQVQLRDTVPQSLLYTDGYGYRSGINNTMRKHLQGLVFDVMKRMNDNLKTRDSVVDIGSNDSTLLRFYPNYLQRYGYDLVPKFAKDYEGTGITFVNEPFGTVHSQYPKFKIITAISMFYDLDNPVDFMRVMADNLEKCGIIVVQQNYLLSMLQINGFDNCVHEHIFYHSVHSMQHICENVGLEIFDVQVNDLNGGSFRTYICHKRDYKIKKSVQKQLDEEKWYGLEGIKCYEDFANRVQECILGVSRFLREQRDLGHSVYLYGCSTRVNTLLQSCGVEDDLVQKGVERNPEKFGKKIASCGIPIISEGQMREEKPDYLFIGPFFFRDEFVRREAKYIKSGGKLIFPLPRLEVVG